MSDTVPTLTYPGAAPAAVDTLGFDRGTGTGEPTKQTEHLLRLMKAADDAFNAHDIPFFLDKLHDESVLVHQFGTPDTTGRPPHGFVVEVMYKAFPDMIVHNDPYDVQFGQGEWTIAIGKLSGTFTGPLEFPGQPAVAPTGKPFLISFTTIARWQNDAMVEEYVLYDGQDMFRQIGILP